MQKLKDSHMILICNNSNILLFVCTENIFVEAVSSKWKSWPHSRILLCVYIEINVIIMLAEIVKTRR